MKELDLLLGHLDLFQRRGDLLEGQVAAFPALGDQRAKLVGVLKWGIAPEAVGALAAPRLLPGGLDTVVAGE